jgi:hypothetical protein
MRAHCDAIDRYPRRSPAEALTKREHGSRPVSYIEYLGNGHSLLAVFLRQKGSPESKPVHHPHSETGQA